MIFYIALILSLFHYSNIYSQDKFPGIKFVYENKDSLMVFHSDIKDSIKCFISVDIVFNKSLTNHISDIKSIVLKRIMIYRIADGKRIDYIRYNVNNIYYISNHIIEKASKDYLSSRLNYLEKTLNNNERKILKDPFAELAVEYSFPILIYPNSVYK